MTLRLKQAAQYEGSDWWKWSISLGGTTRELDRVGAVTYHLHPTFPRPVVEVRDRASHFRLRSSGWGSFPIRAIVTDKAGEQLAMLEHELVLDYPEDAPEGLKKPGPVAPPIVFVSSSAADAPIAESVSAVLASAGYAVKSSQDIALGASIASELGSLVDGVHGFVAVVSSPPNRWVEAEIAAATARGLPVISLSVDGAALSSSLGRMESVHLSATGELSGRAARELVSAVGAGFQIGDRPKRRSGVDE